ncbi:hypothetical protein ACJX0J_035572 [Zea mays]
MELCHKNLLTRSVFEMPVGLDILMFKGLLSEGSSVDLHLVGCIGNLSVHILETQICAPGTDFEPNEISSIHGHVVFEASAEKSIAGLQVEVLLPYPGNSGYYVTAANLYAYKDMWSGYLNSTADEQVPIHQSKPIDKM